MPSEYPTILRTTDLLRGLEIVEQPDGTWEGPGLVMPMASWVFGGIVGAQALIAAAATSPNRSPRSVRVRFLRQASPGTPLHHSVSLVADSNTFSDRRVDVHSGDDLVATVQVVMHIPDETDLGYQKEMPDVAPPDDSTAAKGAGFETIDLNVPPAHSHRAAPARQLHWMRAPGTPPADELINAAMLTMASDIFLVASAWRPIEGRAIVDIGTVMSYGLDFTVWFHHPVSIGNWHLFDADTPSAARGRSLGLANWFHPDGRLVASVALDSVMRVRSRE